MNKDNNAISQKDFLAQFNDLKISNKGLKFVSSEYIFEKSDELNGSPSAFWKEALKGFFTNKWMVGAFSVFVLIVLLAIIVPAVSPYSFNVNVGAHVFDSAGNKKTTLTGLDFVNLPMRFPGLFSGDETRNLSVANFWHYWNAGLVDHVYHYPPGGEGSGSAWNGASQWNSFFYQAHFNLYKDPVLGQHSFILGTDSQGSDRWTNLWDSAAFSLKLAFTVTIIQFSFGVILGAISGYYAGRMFDTLFQRIIDIIGGLPLIIWWMIVVAMFKNPGFLPVLVALVLTGWIGPAYWTRTFIIKYKDAEFVKAADTYGASTWRKVMFHMMPNVTGRLAASFVQRIPYVIYAEASLAILGIGINRLSPGLGTMISNGRSTYLNYPVDMNAPIILIIILVLSLQIMAIGIRDVLDPKISAEKA